MRPHEELSETEDDVTEDWLLLKHEEVSIAVFQLTLKILEDFIDCTPREIRFMIHWDRFVNKEKPQGKKHLPDSLMRFARSHKDILHTESLRAEFWKFLLNLRQYKRISDMVVKSVIGVIPKEIVKMETPRSPSNKSPAKSPRTPAHGHGKRGAPVPSAVTKTDEGSYCLCKSVWCSGMVACSNEDCKNEWYHLSCINLWQRPVGKWVCPKYPSFPVFFEDIV